MYKGRDEIEEDFQYWGQKWNIQRLGNHFCVDSWNTFIYKLIMVVLIFMHVKFARRVFFVSLILANCCYFVKYVRIKLYKNNYENVLVL